MKAKPRRASTTRRNRARATASAAASKAMPIAMAKVPTKAKAKAPATATVPLLTESDLRRAIYELANVLAPADVGDLLGSEDVLRMRATQLDGEPGKLLQAQVELALACLHDHAAGRCPQIPYYTISMLAAGLAYLVDELDLIPDFLPQIGTLDDALVMAMACRLGEDGLRRYCTWKGIDAGAALGAEPGRSRA